MTSATLLGGLFMVPLAYWTGVADSFALPKTALARATIALVLATIAIRLLVMGAADRYQVRLASGLVAVHLILVAMATATSVDPSTSIQGEQFQYQGLMASIVYAATFLVAATHLARTPRLFVWTVAASGTAAALYGVAQRLGLDPVWRVFREGRVFSTFGQPNAFGAFMVLVVPALLGLALLLRSPWRVLPLLGAGVSLVAIAYSFSRGAYLGVGVAIATLALLAFRGSRPDRRTVLRAVLFAGLSIALLGLIAPLRGSFGTVAARAQSAIGTTDLSAQQHFDLWRVGVAIARDHPWLGAGPETFPVLFETYRDEVLSPERAGVFLPYRPESPHNVFVATASGTGVPSLLVYLALISVAMTGALRLARSGGRDMRVTAAVLGAMIAGHVVTDLFMTAEVAGSMVFWAALGVITGLTEPRAQIYVDGRMAVVGGAAGVAALVGVLAVSAGQPVDLVAARDVPATSPVITGERPNFVVIMVDDLRWDELELGFGRSLPDRDSALESELVERGTIFPWLFTSTPLCCPSRVSFLTGLYAHNHGVMDNRFQLTGGFGGWGRFVADGRESEHLGAWLEAAGYRTGLIGKYLNGFPNDLGSPAADYPDEYVPPGWSEFYGFFFTAPASYERFWVNDNGHRVDFGPLSPGYRTDVERSYAVDFIDRNAGAEPFFLLVAASAPHTPLEPAPRHRGAHDEVVLTPPPAFDEEDLADKPLHVRQGARERSLDRWYEDARASLDMTLAVDELIEDVFDAIGRNGIDDSTYVVFVSDNGLLRGEHRLRGKGGPYDEATRTPLLIRGPGIGEGVVADVLASNVDLAPTFLALAGVEPPMPMDGESLLGLLRGDDRREAVLVELRVDQRDQPGLLGSVNNAAYPYYHAVRTAEHLYVEYGTGEIELYDLRRDPYQLDALPAEGADSAELAELRGLLRGLSTCRGETCLSAARRPSALEPGVVAECYERRCALTAVGTSGAPVHWSLENGTELVGATVAHTFQSNGSHIVRVTVDDTAGEWVVVVPQASGPAQPAAQLLSPSD